MNGTQKGLLILSGLVGVGGLIYYLVSERSAGASSGARLFGIKGEIDYVGNYKINNLTGLWLHLKNEDRIRLKGRVKKGDVAKVKGTAFDDVYEVKSVWVDTNGNLGAVLLTPNVPYTPKKAPDRTFEGATITFK